MTRPSRPQLIVLAVAAVVLVGAATAGVLAGRSGSGGGRAVGGGTTTTAAAGSDPAPVLDSQTEQAAAAAQPTPTAAPGPGATTSTTLAGSTAPTRQGAPRNPAVTGAVIADPNPDNPVPSIAPGPQGPLRSTSCATAAGPAAEVPQQDEAGAAHWETIGRATGACGGTSPEFPTTNTQSRLVFRSDASGLVVELVDAVRGRDAAGGQPDLVCGGPCAGTQDLVTNPGRFRIEVQATDAPWEIVVQELRPN